VHAHRDPSDARRSLQRTTAQLDRFCALGGRLVWTVHNALPHDLRHHTLEVELCRFLVARADVVHLLTPGTRAAVAPYYSLGDTRSITVGHASYRGEYPDDVTRDEARARLGLHPDDEVVVALGALRPYRGLERLVEAAAQLRRTRPRLRLLIGGRPGHGFDVGSLQTRLDDLDGSVLQIGLVPDDEVQFWMRAADVAAMPYERVLNSASLPLALTFGLPVVAPALGVFVDRQSEPFVHVYPAGSTAGLTAALDAALGSDDLAERSRAASAAADRFTAAQMSDEFFTSLLAALGLDPATGAGD
jgi:glycosyltransferase involved in cell wall biosynthesis